MRVITIFILILLFQTINPICLDPNQPQGQCTACNPLDILLQKNCYSKMRGCLTYQLPGPICTQCQFGYVLVPEKICKRKAVVQAVLNETIPPVTIDNETLTLDAIQIKLGPQMNPYFTDIHEYFVSNHPELGLGNIVNVETLQTKRGTYFVINYKQQKTSTNYEAVGFLNSTNNIIPLYIKIAQSQKKDPVTANKKIREILGATLNNYFIYSIEYADPNYFFIYMNDSLDINTVNFSRNDIGPTLSTKMIDNNLTIIDLSQQELYKVYPEYRTKTVLSRNRFQNFSTFSFDGNITASVRFYLFQFTVNKPIQVSGNIPTFDNFSLFFDPFGFLSMFGMFDSKYNKCVQLAIAQVPELRNAVQSNVLSKNINTDTYYHIVMQRYFFIDSFDIYGVIDSSSGSCEILLILKNKQATLYTSRYNYNIDPLFFRAYVNATITSKVIKIPSIQSVTMKGNGAGTTYYKAVYSPNQFIEFTFNKTSNVTKIISYTVDGANILSILSAVGTTNQKTQPDLYLKYLSQKNKTSPSSSILSSLATPLLYSLKYVSNNGTYQAKVRNQSTSFQIASLSKLSNQNCYNSENLSERKVQRIINFLKQFYRLNNYAIILVQVMVRKVGNLYRVLTENSKMKKIEYIVEQLYTLPNVVKVITYNDGYQFVQPRNTSPDFQKFTSVTGYQSPLIVQSTSRRIRGYVNVGASTIQVIINKLNGDTSERVYQSYEQEVPQNCKTSDSNGTCLSCDLINQLYKGSCYPKIEGCKVQAGLSCLRCDNPYVLKDKKCKKDCKQLLQPFSIY